jgi:hypothetical protein
VQLFDDADADDAFAESSFTLSKLQAFEARVGGVYEKLRALESTVSMLKLLYVCMSYDACARSAARHCCWPPTRSAPRASTRWAPVSKAASRRRCGVRVWCAISCSHCLARASVPLLPRMLTQMMALGLFTTRQARDWRAVRRESEAFVMNFDRARAESL